MPRRDQTGPNGQGPMTGGGFGRCSGLNNNADVPRGMGRGMGCGRGMGRRGFSRAGASSWDTDNASLDEKIAALTQELDQLKQQRQGA